MSKNPLFLSCEETEKLIRNLHAEPDNHKKLITYRELSLAHAWQVWSTSVFHIRQLSCLQNDIMADGIRIRIFRLIRIRMAVISIPNVVDALSCRRQSCRQVWYKAAVDCMRNANQCPKKTLSSSLSSFILNQATRPIKNNRQRTARNTQNMQYIYNKNSKNIFTSKAKIIKKMKKWSGIDTRMRIATKS